MKTRNLILAMAATAMLASCSSELDTPTTGGEATVSFTATLPGSMSRAFADGTTATTLYYAVYNNGKLLSGEGLSGTKTLENKTTTVNLKLAQGLTYDVVFWAQSDNSPYTFNADGATVTADYSGVTSSDEALDAFYYHEKITVSGSSSKPIELKRPFAQLNIGTNDIAEAKAAGMTVEKATVTVTDVCNKLDLITGAASVADGSTMSANGTYDVTFAAGAIPTEDFPVGGYSYLAMNYVLVGSDNATSTVSLEVDGIGHKYTGVPLSANYRTNIYGALLTSPTDYTVTIDSEFAEGSIMYNNTVYSTIEEAIAATDAKAANNVITLAPGEYTLPTSISKNLTFIGKDVTVSESTAAVRRASRSNEATVINVTGLTGQAKSCYFKNVTVNFTGDYKQGMNFTETVEYENCILNGVQTGYAPNLTFKDCVLNSPSNDYAVWAWGSKNITLDNTTVNIGAGKGLLFYRDYTADTRNIVVKDCTFTSTGDQGKAALEIHSEYGDNGTLTINNVNIDGLTLAQGLWRELNNQTQVETFNYTVTVDGKNARSYAEYAGTKYKTLALAIAALPSDGAAADNVITLSEGEFTIKDFSNKNVTFKAADGVNVSDVVINSNNVAATSCNLVFENVTLAFPNTDFYGGFKHSTTGVFNNCAITGTYWGYAPTATFNNCTFKPGDGKYCMWAYVCNNLTLNNCTFNIAKGKGILFYKDNEAFKYDNITVSNCTFTAESDLGKAALEIHSENGVYGNLNITNTTCTGLAQGLWREVAGSTVTDYFTVTIDGEVVQTSSKL